MMATYDLYDAVVGLMRNQNTEIKFNVFCSDIVGISWSTYSYLVLQVLTGENLVH